MAKDALDAKEREVAPFDDLNHAADVLMKNAEDDPPESYYLHMAALLLTVSTFEGYLNYLGETNLKLWNANDHIPCEQKFGTLCTKLDLHPDSSTRPWQTLDGLFNFRNAVAHGKSAAPKTTSSAPAANQGQEQTSTAPLHEYCTRENTVQVREDVIRIINMLHERAGLGEYAFFSGITDSTIAGHPDGGAGGQ